MVYECVFGLFRGTSALKSVPQANLYCCILVCVSRTMQSDICCCCCLLLNALYFNKSARARLKHLPILALAAALEKSFYVAFVVVIVVIA